MNVALIGNGRPQHATENDWRVSFQALGHHVLFLQEDDMPTGAVETLHNNAIQLLLYVRTWDSLPEEWRAVIAGPPPGVACAGVHLDIWWGLERQHEIGSHAMFDCPVLFSPDGDHDRDWERAGVNHVWLPPAVVDTRLVGETVPGHAQPERWPYDFAFVGSRRHHPEGHRTEFVDYCRARWGTRFVHVGHDGDLAPDDRGRRTLRGQALDDLLATVPIIVGESLFAAPDAHYVSDRAYESPGRGGFCVFPYVRYLADELRHVPSQVYYSPGDFDDMARVGERWLERFRADPSLRPRLVRAGSAWMRNHASYTQRAQTILDVLCARGALCEQVAA